ncbi:hypothetical protein DRO55_00340 [Candidatus Bathyarchaeota archaeon]|nr:MAG: hypothetical protein DRO55_00340 [Candidatus Bathyarchaeota archaeon]
MDEKNDRIDDVEKEINDLKSRVDSLSDDLTNAITELRNAVLEIRTAVSEIENPFNLLRIITNEKDLEKISKMRPRVEGEAPPEALKIELEEETPKAEEEAETVKTVEEVFPEEKPVEPMERPSFKHGVALLRWVYMMLDLGFDEEGIRRLCEYCEFFRFIPKGASPYISNLSRVVMKARAQGLLEEEVILSIYGIAEALGMRIRPEDLSGLLVQVLRKNRMVESLMG